MASVHVQEKPAHSEAARQADQALSVSAPPTLTMRWLIPRLSCLQHQHSSVEVKRATFLAPVDIAANSYDIATRGATAPEPGCHSLPFMAEIIVPVRHVNLLKRAGRDGLI